MGPGASRSSVTRLQLWRQVQPLLSLWPSSLRPLPALQNSRALAPHRSKSEIACSTTGRRHQTTRLEPSTSTATGERSGHAHYLRAVAATRALVGTLVHRFDRLYGSRPRSALLALFWTLTALALCTTATASTIERSSTTATGPRRDLSIVQRAPHPKIEPGPASCPCKAETACGTSIWDPCAAAGTEFNFQNLSTRAVAYWHYLHSYHNECLAYDPARGCTSFTVTRCPTPPILTYGSGDAWCWHQISLRCRPEPLGYLKCLLSSLSFLTSYDEQPHSYCPPVTVAKLVSDCAAYYAETKPILVTSSYYQVTTTRLPRPLAVGKITLHTEATYTCTDEGNPLVDCSHPVNRSCGHLKPSTTSDTAYDVIPPAELRKGHYDHALKIACAWTHNIVFDLIEWFGFLDPNHRLQTPVVWWSAVIQRASTEPYDVDLYEVKCDFEHPVASFQVLTGPTGERYAAGDAAVGDLRSFGATAYYERGQLVMGETHAVMRDLNLQIYSVQFDTHNLAPVGVVLPFHQFSQCYEYSVSALDVPWCERVRFQYLGLRHRDRGLFELTPTPIKCHLEPPGSHRFTIITPGSQALLIPRSVLILNGSTSTVPPAPGLPSPLQIERDRITIQYNLFTFAAALSAELVRLLADPRAFFEQAALPTALLFLLYVSVRRLAWRPAIAAVVALYFLYLRPDGADPGGP